MSQPKQKVRQSSFVVVANRLPVDRVEGPDGQLSWKTAPGGLVTALEPVMRNRSGLWVGWPGSPDEDLAPFEQGGLGLVPVRLSAGEVADYYEGFSNATIWPLYHDVLAPPEYHREWWQSYVEVNRRFAEAAAAVAAPGATVWVQDYQLQLVPADLRRLRPDLRIGFFLHIPFPPAELFARLPWRDRVIEGLLGADLIGFQTVAGAQNFTRMARSRLGAARNRDLLTLADGRVVAARPYPIAIDTRGFQSLAKTPAVRERAAQVRRDLGDPETLFLGVDRLDYTKGIPQRIRAFGELLAEGRLDPAKVAFVQIATPSRERVGEYRRLRDEMDRLVGRINGDHGLIGRAPITYLHSGFGREEMAALYRAADVMVVTPLRDGMNLVAKEYIACRLRNQGALVLSEFAGAAHELRQAYLVNPFDIDALKDVMTQAAGDLPRERQRRMRSLRRQVFEHDIDRWAGAFLDDLARAPLPSLGS